MPIRRIVIPRSQSDGCFHPRYVLCAQAPTDIYESEKAAILFHTRGILAQLGEHLPYKQRVIGSSPIGPTNQFYIDYAGVAELADAQDLKSCGTNLPYRFDSGRRQ